MTDHDCPTCENSFGSQKGVRDHAWDAHGACHYCGDTFEQREALYTHWLDDHADGLSEEDRKRAQNKVGQRTQCPVCEDRFANRSAVRDHAWDAHGACHHCGDSFDDERTLHAHWLGAHGGDLSRENRRRAEDDVGDLSFGDRLEHQGPVGAVTGVSVSRRAMVGGAGAAVLAGLGGAAATGALGGGSGPSDDGTLGGHPAAASLSSQPVLGPPPGDGKGTIVAFEDPSCPACRRFELSVYPKLKRQLVDAGTVSFSYRGIPIVYPAIARTGVHALEAALARDESAFWTLKRLYYENQGQIGRNNVEKVTRQMIAGNTDLDADAVMKDVRDRTYKDAVDTDLRDSRSAGVQATPTFFLFRDGSFVTTFSGAKSYTVFANALGV